MGAISEADAIYHGTKVADKVYQGSTLVWQRETIVEKTWSDYADWSMDYAGDSSQRNGDYLYYGQVSSTWGNNRSLIGFPVPAEVEDCLEIVSARLRFYNVHHYLNDGGDIEIGTHKHSAMPATWMNEYVDQGLVTWGDAPKPGWVDLTLNSTMRAKFKAGAQGIALGPGPSTSTSYYGYAHKHTSASYKPWLQIVYKVMA